MFFPLPHKCTIQEESSTTDMTGQSKKTRVDLYTDVDCLFLEVSGNKKQGPREDFDSVLAFYVEPTVNILRGQFIVDILDKAGNIVEPGPFEVKSAKRTPNLTGGIHHISCKIVGAGRV